MPLHYTISKHDIELLKEFNMRASGIQNIMPQDCMEAELKYLITETTGFAYVTQTLITAQNNGSLIISPKINAKDHPLVSIRLDSVNQIGEPTNKIHQMGLTLRTRIEKNVLTGQACDLDFSTKNCLSHTHDGIIRNEWELSRDQDKSPITRDYFLGGYQRFLDTDHKTPLPEGLFNITQDELRVESAGATSRVTYNTILHIPKMAAMVVFEHANDYFITTTPIGKETGQPRIETEAEIKAIYAPTGIAYSPKHVSEIIQCALQKMDVILLATPTDISPCKLSKMEESTNNVNDHIIANSNIDKKKSRAGIHEALLTNIRPEFLVFAGPQTPFTQVLRSMPKSKELLPNFSQVFTPLIAKIS